MRASSRRATGFRTSGARGGSPRSRDRSDLSLPFRTARTPVRDHCRHELLLRVREQPGSAEHAARRRRERRGFPEAHRRGGHGKDALCRKFLATLDDNWVSAYVPNPNLEPRTLLLALAEEMRVKLDGGLDQHHLLKALTLALLDFARQKKRVVVCLDETQAMPLESLETLRLLTNLETEKRKLVQVILFGQPELDERLAHESIRQLRQRITFQHHLGTLTREETEYYLE